MEIRNNFHNFIYRCSQKLCERQFFEAILLPTLSTCIIYSHRVHQGKIWISALKPAQRKSNIVNILEKRLPSRLRLKLLAESFFPHTKLYPFPSQITFYAGRAFKYDFHSWKVTDVTACWLLNDGQFRKSVISKFTNRIFNFFCNK